MAKMYFKYGVMGSSKTAQALMQKFNFEERGLNVWLIKPKVDDRDGQNIVKSRVGLSCGAYPIDKDSINSIKDLMPMNTDIIICDEAQFLTKYQIDELREITRLFEIPVFCFGLRTDFTGQLFEGSKRLFEVADTFEEIKAICSCGNKATMNARIINGKVVTKGPKILIGGNDKYIGMCYHCWKKAIGREA